LEEVSLSYMGLTHVSFLLNLLGESSLERPISSIRIDDLSWCDGLKQVQYDSCIKSISNKYFRKVCPIMMNDDISKSTSEVLVI